MNKKKESRKIKKIKRLIRRNFNKEDVKIKLVYERKRHRD